MWKFGAKSINLRCQFALQRQKLRLAMMMWIIVFDILAQIDVANHRCDARLGNTRSIVIAIMFIALKKLLNLLICIVRNLFPIQLYSLHICTWIVSNKNALSRNTCYAIFAWIAELFLRDGKLLRKIFNTMRSRYSQVYRMVREIWFTTGLMPNRR